MAGYIGSKTVSLSTTAANVEGNITVTGNVDGRDVSVDGTKLDGIETAATADQTDAEIRTAVESATNSNVFTDADHTKLDGIEASATADQTDAEIRTAVESATDSNVFTDADHTKLNGIETAATADQTDAQIKTAVQNSSDIALAGNPTTTTQNPSNNSTRVATTAYTDAAITALVNSAPVTLDTLNELAAALDDDPNYAATTATLIGTKMPKSGGAFTGAITGTTAGFTRLDINATNTQLKGDLFANTDGAFDIGASGANRPRNLYISNSISAADITTTGAGAFGGTVTADGLTVDGPRVLVQRANDDSSIAFANNASGTPSSHVWATGLDYSNSNAFSIAYGSGGIPSLEDAKLVIDVSGNVRIGDSATDITSKLVVSGNASASVATFMYDGAAGTYLSIDCNAANGLVDIEANARSGNYPPLTFTTGAAERMRISSAGALMVNTAATGTGASPTVSSTGLFSMYGATSAASFSAVSQGTTTGYLNRNTSDGIILDIRKDNTTVGSIRTVGGDMVVGTGDVGFRFDDGSDVVTPWNTSTNSARNNAIDLGHATARFKDLCLSGTARLDNSSSITGKTSGASSFNIASGHTGSGLGLYIGQFGVSAAAAISIDTNRIVTMPAQPAFLAYLSATQNNLTTGSPETTIKFDSEIFDQNGDFTVATGNGQGSDGNNLRGTFTAPVTGKYQFNLSLRLVGVQNDINYMYFFIKSSNRNYTNIFEYSGADDAAYYTVPLSMLADMDANDTAYIQAYQSGGSAETDIEGGASNYSFFSGYLVA